jgi:hypothetical protein
MIQIGSSRMRQGVKKRASSGKQMGRGDRERIEIRKRKGQGIERGAQERKRDKQCQKHERHEKFIK